MPYIKPESRELFAPYIEALSSLITDSGDLNYIITVLAARYLLAKGLSYDHINTVAGVLQKVAAEFDVRVTRPYEDLKIFQNGDVPEFAHIEHAIRNLQRKLPQEIVPDTEQAHG